MCGFWDSLKEGYKQNPTSVKVAAAITVLSVGSGFLLSYFESEPSIVYTGYVLMGIGAFVPPIVTCALAADGLKALEDPYDSQNLLTNERGRRNLEETLQPVRSPAV